MGIENNVAFINGVRQELRERGLKEPTLEEWKKLSAFDTESERDLESRILVAVSAIYGNEQRGLKINSILNKRNY